MGHCEPSLVEDTLVAVPLLHCFMVPASTLYETLRADIKEVIVFTI